MSELPFNKADLADTCFQYLEDISTGYWYSEILFASIELGIFDLLEKNIKNVDELASNLSCGADKLSRLLRSMESLALVGSFEGEWSNSQTASRYLVKSSDEYMGHFILYRKYMQKQWQELPGRILSEPAPPADINDEGFEERFFNYLKATDSLIRLKSKEIVEILNRFDWHFPVLDIGGGAGSLLRTVINSGVEKPGNRQIEKLKGSILIEIEDVIEAGKKLYPAESDWKYISTVGGDFRSHRFAEEEKFGLIILSNFLHAYGSSEAHELLIKACGLLASDGVMIIHDYFPDRTAGFPQKGRLYDLNMMINTYNGKCHESREIAEWLNHGKLACSGIFDLKSDTSVIIAHGEDCHTSALAGISRRSLYEKMQYKALEIGFRRAVPIPAADIVIASWPRLKCRFGCANYNSNLKCPPFGLEHSQTRELISEYSYALLLEGTPPGKDFHQKMLELEKKAFLEGYYKSFVFIAGPCSICPECHESGECRNPKLARPSMEGSGIDVYATCEAAGIPISPVLNKGEYVKYIGLLLLG